MNITRLNTLNDDKVIVKGNGGGSTTPTKLQRNDVNFFDYDGALLYSYTWDEAKELTELPPLPVHDGLEVREWNYTLEDIKEQGVDAITADDWFYILLSTITIDGVEYKKYKWSVEESEWYMIHKSSDAVEVGTICYYYYDDGEETYIYADDGNPYEYPIQDVISIIGKADVGACVYDGDGEQVLGFGVKILERGITVIEGYSNSPGLYGVYSIPNTVIDIESYAFNSFTYLHELKFPISVEDIRSYYAAFFNGYVLNTWWNGANRILDYKCNYGVVLDIQEGIIESNLENAYHIIHAKYPSTIAYIIYLAPSSSEIVLHDFSKLKHIPTIDNVNLGYQRISIIVVPDNLYNEWVSETNWSDAADCIYKVSELP